MKIGKAIKRAFKEKSWIIRRRSWRSVGLWDVAIKLTDACDTCTIIGGNCDDVYGNWNPTADDLMADDWEAVNERQLYSEN